jgi:hypothetical protein
VYSSIHLREETGPISKTFCLLVFRILEMDKVQKTSDSEWRNQCIPPRGRSVLNRLHGVMFHEIELLIFLQNSLTAQHYCLLTFAFRI